eukprot:TRINITY_DN2820_c0_g1_i1.p2 TRINITY_DN2820_c0_g1~~TRINITY_DN2820_c0_g1_i1.p2  ORF type:complete len:280 (-),score=59.80 TRINITY_DN2820_c0_g1_i1:207-1046(-)
MFMISRNGNQSPQKNRIKKKQRVNCKSHDRKYGIIQSDKLILPTHIFNAKRFLMDSNEYNDVKGIPLQSRLKQFRVAIKFAEFRAVAIDLSMFVLEEQAGKENLIQSYGGKRVGKFCLFDRRIMTDQAQKIQGKVGAIGIIGKESLRALGNIVSGIKGKFFRTIEDIEQYPADTIWALEVELGDKIIVDQPEENEIGQTIKQIIEWKEDETIVERIIEDLMEKSKKEDLSEKQIDRETKRGKFTHRKEFFAKERSRLQDKFNQYQQASKKDKKEMEKLM